MTSDLLWTARYSLTSLPSSAQCKRGGGGMNARSFKHRQPCTRTHMYTLALACARAHTRARAPFLCPPARSTPSSLGPSLVLPVLRVAGDGRSAAQGPSRRAGHAPGGPEAAGRGPARGAGGRTRLLVMMMAGCTRAGAAAGALRVPPVYRSAMRDVVLCCTGRPRAAQRARYCAAAAAASRAQSSRCLAIHPRAVGIARHASSPRPYSRPSLPLLARPVVAPPCPSLGPPCPSLALPGPARPSPRCHRWWPGSSSCTWPRRGCPASRRCARQW